MDRRTHKSSRESLTKAERFSRVPSHAREDRTTRAVTNKMAGRGAVGMARPGSPGYSPDVPHTAKEIVSLMARAQDSIPEFDPLGVVQKASSILDELSAIPGDIEDFDDVLDLAKSLENRVSSAREHVSSMSQGMLDLSSEISKVKGDILEMIPSGIPVLDELRSELERVASFVESPLRSARVVFGDLLEATSVAESVLVAAGADAGADEVVADMLSNMGHDDAAGVLESLARIVRSVGAVVDEKTIRNQIEGLKTASDEAGSLLVRLETLGVASHAGAIKIKRIFDVADKGHRIAVVVVSAADSGVFSEESDPANSMRTMLAAAGAISEIAGTDLTEIVSKVGHVVTVSEKASALAEIVGGMGSDPSLSAQMDGAEKMVGSLTEMLGIVKTSGLVSPSALSRLDKVVEVADRVSVGIRAAQESVEDIAPYVRENISAVGFGHGGVGNARVDVRGIIERSDEGWVVDPSTVAPADSPEISNLRSTHSASGHPSPSKLSTDFSNKGSSPRDVVEAADSFVRSDATGAVPLDGFGDLVLDDDAVSTQPRADPRNGPVGPMDRDRWTAYTDTAALLLGGGYSGVNPVGMLGKYQFSAADLADRGYVVPGTSSRSLHLPSAWTGKDGMTDRESFLSNEDLQEKMFFDVARATYKSLLRCRVVESGDDPGVVAGFMGVAQVVGFAAARSLADGHDHPDSWGNRASAVAAKFESSVASGVPSNETTEVASKLGATTREQMRAYVGSTTLPDGASVVPPPSDSSVSRYPANDVREFEAGHFKEYDSTPGAERIQERHRTGTGYEVDASGNMKSTVVADSYTAILGNDTIVVHGHCNIVVMGDVGIKSDGDININSGRDLNVLVGGDMNFKVDGNVSERVDGSVFRRVSGDVADHVVGRRREGVDGDFFLEAASINGTARSTEVNFLAETDANYVAKKTTHVVGTEKIRTTTGGDHLESVGGDLNSTAEGDHTVRAETIYLN